MPKITIASPEHILTVIYGSDGNVFFAGWGNQKLEPGEGKWLVEQRNGEEISHSWITPDIENQVISYSLTSSSKAQKDESVITTDETKLITSKPSNPEAVNKSPLYVIFTSDGEQEGKSIPETFLTTWSDETPIEPTKSDQDHPLLRQYLLKPGMYALHDRHSQSATVIYVEQGLTTVVKTEYKDERLDGDSLIQVVGKTPSSTTLQNMEVLRRAFERNPSWIQLPNAPISDEDITAKLLRFYARLRTVTDQTDRLLSDVWAGKESKETAVEDETQVQDWISKLTLIAKDVESFQTVAPNSPDVRVLGLSARLEEMVLRQYLAGKAARPTTKTLRGAAKSFKGKVVRILYIFPVIFLLLSLYFGISEPAKQLSGNDKIYSQVGVIICVLALAASVAALIRARSQSDALRVAQPPLFSEGFRLAMRLSALYKAIVTQESPLIGTALRWTPGTTWTSWDTTLTEAEARKAFAQSIEDIQSLLEQQLGCSQAEKDNSLNQREQATTYIAASLNLPVSFIGKQLKSVSTKLLSRARCVAAADLSICMRKRLFPTFGHAQASPFDAKRFANMTGPAALPETDYKQRLYAFVVAVMKFLFEVIVVILTTIFAIVGELFGGCLLELLVVIAIIAILAAILFPVFAQARRATKKSVCIGQVKDISLGTLMYENDNDDMYPLFIYEVNKKKGPDNLRLVTMYFDVLHQYVHSDSIFKCPQDSNAHKDIPWNDILGNVGYKTKPSDLALTISYIPNNSLFLNAVVQDVKGLVPSNGSIDVPGETVLFYESRYAPRDTVNEDVAGLKPEPLQADLYQEYAKPSTYLDFPNFPGYARHGHGTESEGLYVSFVDGHAKFISKKGNQANAYRDLFKQQLRTPNRMEYFRNNDQFTYHYPFAFNGIPQ